MRVAQEKARIVEEGRAPWFLIPKARRMGVTTRETAVSFYRTRVFPGQYCATIAHRREDVESVFQDQAKRFLTNLPTWHRPPLRFSNRTELLFAHNGSRFYVGTGAALALGRGTTLQRVHVTEVAHIPKQVDIDNMFAGLTQAAEYGDVTAESTGNGCQGWFYQEVMDSIAGKSAWSTIFLPWFLFPGYRIPLEPGERIAVGVPHCHDAEGYVDDERDLVEMAFRDWGVWIDPEQLKWRRKKRRQLRRNRLFYQEFPERISDCFQAAAACFFDAEALKSGATMARDPVSQDYGDGWSWKVWRAPTPGCKYLVGVDVAEGVEGGDYTVISIHERRTFEQVACWHGHIHPKAGGRLAVEKATEYNRAVLGIERNNHGHASVAEAAGYAKLYKHVDGRKGWLTSTQTRPELIGALRDAVEEWEPGPPIRDASFWEECHGFLRQPSGKFEGSPDDRLFAVGIALQLRERSSTGGRIRNLAALEDPKPAEIEEDCVVLKRGGG